MKPFEAPFWARNPHTQTLLGASIDRMGREVALARERVTLPDGDFLDLDWLRAPPAPGPILLILHGLEGSSRSPYIARLLRMCASAQWNAVVMHFRGCSGEPNHLPRSYHGGETSDLQAVVDIIIRRHDQGLCAVGYSLGGSVLLKWLGERRGDAGLKAAAAVSVPFDLASAAERLDSGFSRLYQWVLLRWLRQSVARKARHLGHAAPPLKRLRNFRDFDRAITAPLHGFRDADDYYQHASCRPYLRHIKVPTLLVQAADDPFLMPHSAPDPEELAPTVRLEMYPRGGHVGFISGGTPWAPRFWLEDRLRTFLEPAMCLEPGHCAQSTLAHSTGA
ncbi:MAG: hydrolase [Acidiferrobacter sp.]